MKMDMEVFAQKICAAVEKELGSGFRTEVREVRKNNGILLHGLLILSEGRNVTPTIYLEHFLEDHKSGLSFEGVVRRLLAVYRKDMPPEDVDMEFFRNFENVRDKICCRLIGRKANEELLKEIPYVEFLDLAVCFYYAYQEENLGGGTILIYNSHMEMWNTCTAEFSALAERNTQRLFPWECRGIKEMMEEIVKSGDAAGAEDSVWTFDEIPMKILTNSKKTDGAVCILYSGILDGIARETGSDLFILPASVHEAILLPVTGSVGSETLKEMVREVNSTQVAPEEVLSDSLYRYDRAEKRIVIV